MLRSNTCGELSAKDVGSSVTLCGWCHSRRDHGGVVFIDLRDRYGVTQVVFNPGIKGFDEATGLRREDVIKIVGEVKIRPKGMENPNISTGEIEVVSAELEILNKAETPPLEIDDRVEASEDIRLKYRYIDLRRPKMQNYLRLRHNAAMATRKYLSDEGFLEIETPLLMKATPEGARDYIVPSRVHPGKFYALPQSPQLYKQLLMVGGCDKYFQMAKCLRDEDLRSDRQPEFTQIDVEMSFPTQDSIFKVGEGLVKAIMKESLGVDVPIPFPRLSYKDSMDRFGCDKPDLRFGLELTNVTDIVVKSDFGVFKDVVASKGIIKCINPEVDIPRKDIDKYVELCKQLGSKGMAWMRVTDKGLESNIAKYFNEDVQKELLKKTKAKPGSVLMFIADRPKQCNDVIYRLRNKLGEDFNLYDKKEFRFCWVVDFPLFEFDEETEQWMPAHHMFTMPKKEHLQFIESDPGKVFASCYDLVLNGVELASGSIRIHRPDIQERVMKRVGFPKELAEQRFGFLLEAFKYGAPPHGGFAIGFDRIIAMMCGLTDIREVIAFPKNKSAECPMDNCPSEVDALQLKELHIKTEVVKKKNAALEEIKEMFLKEKKEFEILEHAAVFTADEAAKARKVELYQVAKSLICKAGKEFVMVVIPGNKELDLNKLKDFMKAEKVELASSDDIKKLTGLGLSSIPIFGNLFGIETIVDEHVTKEDIIAFNAASATTSIKTHSKSYVDILRPKVAKISK